MMPHYTLLTLRAVIITLLPINTLRHYWLKTLPIVSCERHVDMILRYIRYYAAIIDD